ncbi:MAG: ABC transporter substrate-binding protein [Pirellulales bacterium]
MIRSLCLLGVGILLLVSGVSGCGGGPDANEILIGHYCSLTGNEATFGRSSDEGVRMAVEEINAAGGIKGKKLKVITYDDKGDTSQVGVAVTRLINKDGVVAVLGEVASSLSLAAAPICQESQIPMVSTSSTNPKVTEVGDMIFRVCYIDSFQGWACAKFAREHETLKAQTAAILYDQTAAYSVGLKEEFAKSFTLMGGRIVATKTYQAGDQDLSPQLTAILSSQPDVLFIPGYYTDVGNIAIQARRLGLDKPLLGGDGWDSAKLGEIAGKAIEGCFFSNHYSHEDPKPIVREFLAKYKEQHGKIPDALAPLSYDAARMLAAAMERAKSLAGPDIAAELAKTKNFDGVTGVITMDANRNANKPIVIQVLKDGVPRYVTTIEPREEE